MRLLIFFDGLLLFALLAFCCVCLDLLHDLGDLFGCLLLLFFNLIAFSIDTGPLSLALLLLLFGLALKKRDSLSQMGSYDVVNFLFGCKHAS